MSNVKDLTKKVELFERLASFGDRGSFLKSLAQDYGSISDNSAYQNLIDTVRAKILDWSHTSGETLEGIGNLMPQKVMTYYDILDTLKHDITLENLNKVKNVVSTLAQMKFNDAGHWVNSVLPLLSQLDAATTKKQTELSQIEVPMETPAIAPAGATQPVNTPKANGQKIDPNLQDALNRLGSPVKLALDGELGPETRKAINWFRSAYNVPANASDQDVFATIKYHSK